MKSHHQTQKNSDVAIPLGVVRRFPLYVPEDAPEPVDNVAIPLGVVRRFPLRERVLELP